MLSTLIKKSTRICSLVILVFVISFQAQNIHAEGASTTVLISDSLSGWTMNTDPRMKDPKIYWTIGSAKIDPKDSEKLLVSKSIFDTPMLINPKKSEADIYTKQVFGDCTVELEVMVPKGSNSGIYLMGQYEVQVKDSFGKEWFLGNSDMGGIVGISKPKNNVAKNPGEWQDFLIEFKAPRFKNGRRLTPAKFVRVVLNGQLIQENVLMKKGPTSGARRKGEFEKGPLMLQGGLGAVAYRNIRIQSK
ncbi:MAG: DUF1080 domain-containing protein [Candidatus Marinimicrobia bacterium]|jgi:hypothetical protein|nr:DUF1080 domain-containing protein [Candidatus Neomarinimicrobiota bacterium]